MTAKNVLSVFVALGLKTHLEATVVNDADGNSYKLSFCKGAKPVSEDDEEWESVFHKNTDYTNLMSIQQFKAALKELNNE